MGTHASDHNCVSVPKPRYVYSLTRSRAEDVDERRQRDIKKAKKGKMDEELVKRGLMHDAAFLCPVPFTEWQPALNCLSLGGSYNSSYVAQSGHAMPTGAGSSAFVSAPATILVIHREPSWRFNT